MLSRALRTAGRLSSQHSSRVIFAAPLWHLATQAQAWSQNNQTHARRALSFVVAAGVVSTSTGTVCARSASTVAAEEVTQGVAPLVMYQYSVCPWCNKLRAFLDYHQLPYSVIEVNPSSKKELEFSEYKKVPIVIMGTEQLNDSTEIIAKLSEVMLADGRYEAGALAWNMGAKGASEAKAKELSEWAGKELVNALTCSIYRTPSESLQAMEYIISHGEFTWFEKMRNQYGGGAIMYLVSKRMKKKYGIEDERQSVYQAVSTWVAEVGDRKFLGGDAPCRTDLEVFGYLRAVKDMDTFSDTLKNTRLGPWYRSMEEEVGPPNLVALEPAASP